MRSSISSSERNTIHGRWLRTAVCGFLVAVLLLAAWEISWRGAGFSPAIEDDLGIWALNRRAVESAENPAIVLLGASRMQLDVNPLIVQEQTGYRTFMLAIDGSSPLPVLEDIAENSSFDGIILCSLLPQWLGDSESGKSRSAKWVRKFHKKKWSFWIETRLSLFLQSHFVFRYPGLQPARLWEKFLAGEVPSPPYAPMRRDRYRPADYTKTDIVRLKASRIIRQKEIVAAARPMNEQDFSARIDEINAIVQQLQERGGRVIFLRLPSCGEILGLEEETWPRRRYWEPFTAEVSAPALNFVDYPELSGFDCPDGSHLGFRDAAIFTRSLLNVLDLQ